MFTARYGLIPYTKQITFRLQKVKITAHQNGCAVQDKHYLLSLLQVDSEFEFHWWQRSFCVCAVVYKRGLVTRPSLFETFPTMRLQTRFRRPENLSPCVAMAYSVIRPDGRMSSLHSCRDGSASKLCQSYGIIGKQRKPALSTTLPTTVSEKLPPHQAHVPASRETAFVVIGTAGSRSMHFSHGKWFERAIELLWPHGLLTTLNTLTQRITLHSVHYISIYVLNIPTTVPIAVRITMSIQRQATGWTVRESSLCGREIFLSSIPAPIPTQPPVKWIPGLPRE